METPFTVYKLIILYMLSHSDTELTNSQLSEFILDRDYTNYFHLQQAISELVEAGLIYKRVKSNSSYYQITSESDLSPEIRKDVSEFLKTAGYEVQNSIVTPADYYITSQGNYSVRCQLLEKNISLIDLNISVPTLEAAEAVCKAWPLKYQKIYDKLMEELL